MGLNMFANILKHKKYEKKAFRNMQKMCFGNVGIPVFQLLKTDQAINASRQNMNTSCILRQMFLGVLQIG